MATNSARGNPSKSVESQQGTLDTLSMKGGANCGVTILDPRQDARGPQKSASGDTETAVQSSAANETMSTHAPSQDSAIPSTTTPGKVKTEKKLEKERKKAQQQAKFEQKKAVQAQAAAVNATKTKEIREKGKKVQAEALPPFLEDTPVGEKKRLKPLDDPYYSSYHPVAVESAWYAWWENEGFFKPQFTPDGDIKPEGKFVIVVPPPNVTGALQ